MPFVQEHLNIFLKNIPEGPQESIGEVPSVWLLTLSLRSGGRYVFKKWNDSNIIFGNAFWRTANGCLLSSKIN